MTVVDGLAASQGAVYARAVEEAEQTEGASKAQERTPEPSNPEKEALLSDLDLPVLPSPIRAVSIDQLMQAIANEERRNGVRSAVDAIKVQGEDLAALGEKKLEEIAKQIEEAKKQSFWQKFCNVFKIIGAVLGAIASVATIALGAATGNAALVVAGVVGAVMTIDSAVSLATDGKASLAAGFQKAAEKCGMSQEAAKWFGFGMTMALTVAGVAASFGAGIASSGTAAGNAVMSAVSKATTVTNMATAATGIASGAGSIGKTVADYKVALAESRKVDIDALLEQLRQAIKTNEDFVEEEMKASQNLMQAVKNIINDCGATANAVLAAVPTPA